MDIRIGKIAMIERSHAKELEWYRKEKISEKTALKHRLEESFLVTQEKKRDLIFDIAWKLGNLYGSGMVEYYYKEMLPLIMDTDYGKNNG